VNHKGFNITDTVLRNVVDWRSVADQDFLNCFEIQVVFSQLVSTVSLLLVVFVFASDAKQKVIGQQRTVAVYIV